MMTYEEVREWFHYDPETGVLTWLKNPGKKRQAGRPAGCPPKAGDRDAYVTVCLNYRLYQAHRLAFLYMTGRWPEHLIDHKDGDRSNNRWDNIRNATYSQNAVNKGPRGDCSSGVTGVSYRSDRGVWRAYISFEGKTRSLGNYPTKEAARAARRAAEVAVFGEFARAA